ncbi:MAG: hypothetical protein ACTSV7_14835 [Candidatus Baldrarchaeia archaeon]
MKKFLGLIFLLLLFSPAIATEIERKEIYPYEDGDYAVMLTFYEEGKKITLDDLIVFFLDSENNVIDVATFDDVKKLADLSYMVILDKASVPFLSYIKIRYAKENTVKEEIFPVKIEKKTNFTTGDWSVEYHKPTLIVSFVVKNELDVPQVFTYSCRVEKDGFVVMQSNEKYVPLAPNQSKLIQFIDTVELGAGNYDVIVYYGLRNFGKARILSLYIKPDNIVQYNLDYIGALLTKPFPVKLGNFTIHIQLWVMFLLLIITYIFYKEHKKGR